MLPVTPRSVARSGGAGAGSARKRGVWSVLPTADACAPLSPPPPPTHTHTRVPDTPTTTACVSALLVSGSSAAWRSPSASQRRVHMRTAAQELLTVTTGEPEAGGEAGDALRQRQRCRGRCGLRLLTVCSPARAHNQ
jgi:hypothetical protein